MTPTASRAVEGGEVPLSNEKTAFHEPLSSPMSEHESVLATKARVGLTPGIVVSILAHLAVFGGAWAFTLLQPAAAPKKFIAAHLVARGKPATKGALPTKAASAPLRPNVAPSPGQPPPSPSGVPQPRAAPSKTATAAAAEKTIQQRMDEVLKGVKSETPSGSRPAPFAVQNPNAATSYEQQGVANGSDVGTDTTGEIVNTYGSECEEAIRRNYFPPNVISERERMFLKTEVTVSVGPDGSMLGYKITKPSGNSIFDSAVEGALRKTHLPPPPPELRELVRAGLGIVFSP